jgi:hypothetical protein
MSKQQTIKTEWLPLASVKPNPDNPRHITEANYEKLRRSINDMPEMLEVRPLVVNMDNVVLGGNMRLKAMQAAGAKKVPVMRVDWPEDKQRAFIIKDNAGFGEWDWDVLDDGWEADALEEWGLEFPKFGDLPVMEGARDQTHHDVDNYLDSGIVRFQLLYSDEEAEPVKAWFEALMKSTGTENYSDAIQSLANEGN